jgi:D-alanine-D-alanine ligase
VSDTAVIFGGPSPEHDVSVLTGLQATRALGTSGTERIRPLYWTKSGDWFEVAPELEGQAFVDGVPPGSTPLRLEADAGGGFQARTALTGRPRPLDISAVVICCHGGPGEDGTLQSALDLAGVRYTGPTAAGAALGMDKLAFAGLAIAAGLPTLPRILLTEAVRPDFDGPYIVKPRFGGSSIGIEVVEDLTTATARLLSNAHLRRGAVVEPYRPDLFDLNVSVRSWPELKLSAIERPLRSEDSSDILSYTDKYVGGEGMASAPRELPAQLDSRLEARLTEAAHLVAGLVDLRGVARIDFLSDGTDLYVNEVNTVPGSMAKYLWVAPPVAFSTLLADMLAEAMARPAVQHLAVGADGAVLRSAGSIASKLA